MDRMLSIGEQMPYQQTNVFDRYVTLADPYAGLANI